MTWRHVALCSFVAGLAAGGWAPAAAVPLAVVAAVAARTRVPAAVAVLAVATGTVVGDQRRQAIDEGRAPAAVGAPARGEVTLLERLRPRASGERVAAARWNGGWADGQRVLLRLRAPATRGRAPMTSPAPGSVMALRGRVVRLRPFDEHQRRRGSAVAVEVSGWWPTGRRRGGLAGVLDRVRERAERGLAAGLPAAEAALMRGMVLGQDESIAPAVREDFQVSGLAHILAVSGTNVMLLAALVLAIGAVAGLSLRWRLGAALVLVALYVPLAGGGPSIQRAGVMGAAGLVAALAGRASSRWYALGLAAAVTLALNPYALADPGWQLSFAAVVGLLAIAPRVRERLERRRLPAALVEVTAMTLAATVATAPLLALHFDRVSLVSLPANVLAAPLVAPIMWLGMLAAAVAQLAPPAALPLAALAGPLAALLGWLADAAAAVPFAAVALGAAPVVAGYLLALAAFLARRRVRRWAIRLAHGRLAAGCAGASWARPAVAVPSVVAGALVTASIVPADGPPPPRPGETVVSFLDVGQGDATLVQRDGAALLVDTGPPDGPILQRLREAGVDRLDVLLVTHAQADHEGAAPEVIRRFRPRLVINGGAGWPSPVQRVLARIRTATPQAGQTLRIGALELRVLWPSRAVMQAPPAGDPNERAVVAHLRSGPFDLLLPADAESPVTAPLRLPRVEALKVAHHGSEDAGLPALLERIRPAVAAIEVGRGNRYGHPRPATLAALRAVPRVFRTDRHGTVRLRWRAGRLTVQTEGGWR